MTPWPHIPDDAVDWFRAVFAEANRRVTERLLNVPNIRETALDDGLIEAVIPFSPPSLLPSGAMVEMNVHNIGGLRRLGPWETADIAVLVFVYRNEALVSQKIGLLQSKRLYPSNNDVDDEDPVGFAYGMNKFLRRDGQAPTLAELEAAGSSSNWRLETWAADLLLRCKVGQQFGEDRQEIVGRLLERRSGPIAAAIAVSIALPEG